MSGEPAFEKISSKTLRHAVYLQLRERIISGKLLPGQSISLRNIAEQLGVSISPVRDAVWQLESEKILVVESNKSIRVNSLDAEEMQEALNIRLLLETQAAEMACELRSEDVSPADQVFVESTERLDQEAQAIRRVEQQVSFCHLFQRKLTSLVRNIERALGENRAVLLPICLEVGGSGEDHRFPYRNVRGNRIPAEKENCRCLTRGPGDGRGANHPHLARASRVDRGYPASDRAGNRPGQGLFESFFLLRETRAPVFS